MQDASLFVKEKKVTLRDRAAEQLRAAILSGKLLPGTRLIEQDLSKEMGISRLPIREAIFHLEQEGLVTIEPYKGAFVSFLSAKEIEELYSIRILFEAHALRLFMENSTPENIQVLEKLVEQMDEAQEGNNTIAFYDFEFHNELCKLCEHSTLYKLWSTLIARIHAYMNIEMQNSWPPKIRENHVRLLDIIKSGDIDAATYEMQCHLQRGRDALLKAHAKSIN